MSFREMLPDNLRNVSAWLLSEEGGHLHIDMAHEVFRAFTQTPKEKVDTFLNRRAEFNDGIGSESLLKDSPILPPLLGVILDDCQCRIHQSYTELLNVDIPMLNPHPALSNMSIGHTAGGEITYVSHTSSLGRPE